MNQDHRRETDGANGTAFRATWVLIGSALIAAYLLVAEHQAHVFAWLWSYGIWLLLLVCPLMHLFMHGSNVGHRDHGGARKKRSEARSTPWDAKQMNGSEVDGDSGARNADSVSRS